MKFFAYFSPAKIRRILLGSIALLVLLATSVLVIRERSFSARSDDQDNNRSDTHALPSVLSRSSEKGVGSAKDSRSISLRPAALSTGPALGVALNAATGQLLYIDVSRSVLMQVGYKSTDSSPVTIRSLPASKVINEVLWSSSLDKFYYNSGGVWRMVNVATQEVRDLDSHISQLRFSPNGTRALYFFDEKSGERSLAFAASDFKQWQVMNQLDPRIQFDFGWITDSSIYIVNRAVPPALPSELVRIDLGVDAKIVKRAQSDLVVTWDPTGKRAVFLHGNPNDGFNYTLLVSDGNGLSETTLNILADPRKCSWSHDGQRLYCAISTDLLRKGDNDKNSPAAQVNALSSIQHSFWILDLAKNEARDLYIPDKTEPIYEVTEFFVAPTEDYLFFVNKNDGRLYSLKLK